MDYDLSDILFEKMKMVEPYPDGIKPVNAMLNIRAFFPGGRGVFWGNNENKKRVPRIMVIGNEFSTYEKYQLMCMNKADDLNSPTWQNMIKLFSLANIDLSDCFFTNVFMGLKEEKSMIKKAKGYGEKSFIQRNLKFLLIQIETVKPTVIITLGKTAANMLSELSPTDLFLWKGGMALSVPDNGFKKNICINGVKYHCVALEHPSMRNSNVKRREYKIYKGNDAEVNMLIDATTILK